MHKKTLDLTTAKWAQNRMDVRERNAKARAYSKSVTKHNKANWGDKAITVLAGFACVATLAWVVIDAFELKPLQAANVATEQEYIVRYGTVDGYDATNGDMLIATNDGNLWALADSPCYENGTKVRVLFNSNGTEIITDDVIIDITVR